MRKGERKRRRGGGTAEGIAHDKRHPHQEGECSAFKATDALKVELAFITRMT